MIKKLNKLKWVVAIAAAFFVSSIGVTAHAAKGDYGVDTSIYQGYSGKFGYAKDKFGIAQIGGINNGYVYSQNTYQSQVQQGLAWGKRMHSYIWFQVGGSTYNANVAMNYFLPKITTPKGSIVALDYEDGASWDVNANTNAILTGMRRVKAAGYTPLLYSGKYYINAHVNWNRILQEFPNSGWMAAYPDYQVRSTPYWGVFPSMPGVAMYQFTSTYVAGGLDGDIDLLGVTDNGYTKNTKPSTPTNKKNVDVTYALHSKGGNWLADVKNFGSGSNGFAGVPNSTHDMLYIKVNHGSIKYRVHTIEDGWLPYVTKGDKKDTVNGVAGIKGHTIDGVQMYYTTPSGETYQQAYYRSQTTNRTGYLGTCADNGTVSGYDSWAGMLGEPLDRLQIHINDNSKY